MRYPSNIKKEYTKVNTTHANRGMDLENLINLSNNYYLEIDKANIHKKPTPIKIVNACFTSKGRKITEAYFEAPSTLDYNGIYKGRYIDFDAKETKEKSRFPLSNIHEHQIKHMRSILKHGGITFLLISMNNDVYYLDGNNIIDFIDNNERKSIPFEYIKDHGYIVTKKINPRLDYLEVLDNIYFKE